jgi:hypothetical protein
MSDDNSSSEVNVNVYDRNGYVNEPKTDNKKSSETDYYFSHIANHNKTLPVGDKKDSSEEHEDYNNESEKSNNSSKNDSANNSEANNRYSESKRNTHSESRRSETKSETRTESRNKTKSETRSETREDIEAPKVLPLNPQEIRMKKIELLRKLSEIKAKGFTLTKAYDFNSSLEEMEYEYELLKSFVDKRNGIKIYKNLLLNGVSIVEFLNDKYDPFAFHLDGWGEHMSVEVDSYDEVLEELYEKYKGTGKKMPPELKLLLLIIASGSAFHFTKSHSSIPGLESIISKNPDLISKLLNPPTQKSQFMSEQELNIEKQRALIQEKERNMKAQMAQKRNPQPMYQPPTQPQPVPNVKQEIKIAPNIKEIIERMKQAQVQQNVSDTQDESSNNERVVSDTNVSESKRGKRNTKSSIPTISVRT